MLAHSVDARRRACDNLNGSDSSPHDFKIEDDVRINYINTHSKYKQHSSEKKAIDKSEEDEKLRSYLPISKISRYEKWNSLRLLLC